MYHITYQKEFLVEKNLARYISGPDPFQLTSTACVYMKWSGRSSDRSIGIKKCHTQMSAASYSDFGLGGLAVVWV